MTDSNHKLVEGGKPVKRLNLRNGNLLRLEVKARPGGGFEFRVMAVVQVGQKFHSKQIASTEVDNEEALWIAIISFGNDRLCDIADERETVY